MRNRFALSVAILLLALPGCLHPWGYYPNGYYGPGPSVLPSQPWNAYPNQPGFQPGVPINQPGGTYPTPIDGSNPYVPGSTPGTNPYTPNSNSPSTYGDPGSGNQPGFNSTPGNTGGSSVPQPGDDDFNRQPAGSQRPTITPTSSQKESEEPSPFDDKETRRERRFDNTQVADTDPPFESPVRQASGSDTNGADVQLANQQAEAVPVSFKTYANDPKFAWVQGIVEYDDQNSLWVVMYSDRPRPTDPYGGELTLADDPELSRLRSGEVYRIYGSLDQTERDARGRPLFQMTKAELRRPVGKQR